MVYKNVELLEEIRELILGKISNRWMNIKEVSNYTSVSQSTIRRAIQKGVLKVSTVSLQNIWDKKS